MTIPLVHAFFFCPRSLTPALELSKKYHIAAIVNLLCETPSDYFDKDHFYLFGWSGRLLVSERKKAARELYIKLKILQRQYQAQSIQPHFSIIAHSHGGNVALHLAELAHEDNEAPSIEKLILLACPVQVETESYVNAPLFKNIFSIHSHHDILQVLDPQGIHQWTESFKHYGLEFTLKNLKMLGPLFSKRHFPKAPHVMQLNVRYAHRELFHLEFLLPAVIKSVPTLITMMKAHTKNEASPIDDITHILDA